jgi:NADH-quinone oxidoreductase subunit L
VVGALALLAEEGGEAAATAVKAAPNWFVEHAFLVPLFLFASAALTLFFGKRTPGKGPVYGITALVAGLVFALGAGWSFIQGGGNYEHSIEWFTIGPLHVELGYFVDGLTAVMLVVVTSVSLMVHIYSLGYMHGDKRYTWFYFVLSLFTAAMLVVVLADNLFLLLVGWEIMGVCSYLLIGHWYEDPANSGAAIKAFITTRVGDVPFMFGIFCCVLLTGMTTSNIGLVSEAAAHSTNTVLVTAAALLMFGGTIGKSAQFPLHVWLPDAMAGPTPVSALIHAATMVAAGIYLVARTFEVFVSADPVALTVVALVGGVTLLLAALLALVQDDIKKVLAYSTISQLAYMVAALGMGEAGYPAAMFHLFTHAFFKALLFLGAGSVIHAVHSNNMSDMGGLRKSMKVTFGTFLIGSLALAGVPPFSGFFSKDEIILAAKEADKLWLVVVLLVGAVLTAFYTTRMVLKTFYGDYRGHEHLHESPRSMTVPLVLLAATTCVVGLLGFAPAGAPFLDWVYFGTEPHTAIFSPLVATLSIAAVLIGAISAWSVYRDYKQTDPITRLGSMYTLLEHKYYLDDFYWGGIVQPVRDNVSAGVYWFNQNVIDGFVNAVPAVTVGVFSKAVMWVDRNIIDALVNGFGALMEMLGRGLRHVQSGKVQWYAVGLFAGVIVVTLFVMK